MAFFLLYEDDDLTLQARTNDIPLQGTYLFTGTALIKQQLTLAGQLLAKKLEIDANFDGSGFRYVPFDPPVAKVGASHKFKEKGAEGNPIAQLVPIVLDKKTKVGVTIKYCFELSSTDKDVWPEGTVDSLKYANINDFDKDYLPPICDKNESKTLKIFAEDSIPKSGDEINIYAWTDNKIEGDEIVRLKIIDVDGAIMPNGSHAGMFKFVLEDGNTEPWANYGNFAIYKDEDVTFPFVGPYFIFEFDALGNIVKSTKVDAIEDFDNFAKYIGYESPIDKDFKGIQITSIPEKGTLKNGTTTVKNKDKIDLESLADLKALTYESVQDSFGADYGKTRYTTIQYKVYDTDGTLSQKTYTMTIFVAPVNDAPVVADTLKFKIPENSTNTFRTDAITVKDVDDSKFTYAYADTTAYANNKNCVKLFALNTDGTISPTKGAVLNYEKDSIYTCKVIVTDVNSTKGSNGKQSDTFIAKITLTDVNDPPQIDSIAGNFNIAENAPANVVKKGDVVGLIKISDEDAGDKLTASFVQVGTKKGPALTDLFAIDTVTVTKIKYAQITVLDSTKLDYEKIMNADGNAVYKFKVTITDSKKATADTTATITIQDVNEKPVAKDQEFKVDYHSNPGDTLVKVDYSNPGDSLVQFVATDPDLSSTMNGTLVYSISGTGTVKSGKFPFGINSENGKIYALEDAVFDYLKQSVYKFTVKATDKGTPSLFDTATVTITLTNNPPQIDSIDTNYDVNEHEKEDYIIGKIKISDADKNDKLTATITDAGSPAMNPALNTLFKVEVNATNDTAIISVKSSPDYETIMKNNDESVYKITLTITDKAGQTATAPTQITVKDINEKPEISPQTFSIHEKDAKSGASVGAVIASDPDLPATKFGTLTYSITTKDMPFDIDSKTGKITISENVTRLHYEEKSVYTFTVRVKDGGGKHADADITVKLIDDNEPPEIPEIKDNYDVKEHSSKDSVFAVIEVIDEDGGDDEDDLTATITDNKVNTKAPLLNSLFGVKVTKHTDGKLYAEIYVKNNNSPDFETIYNAKNDSIYEITLTITDDDGLSASAKTKITVKDINEKPVAVAQTFKVNENSKKGTVVGTFKASDPDLSIFNNGTLVYTIVDKNVPFAIDPSSAEITVADSSKLDYETVPDHKFEFNVKVADKGKPSQDTTVLVTVNLIDQNDDPIIDPLEDSYQIAEHSAVGKVVAKVHVSDQDEGVFKSDLTAKIEDLNENTKAPLLNNLFTVSVNATNDTVTIAVKNDKILDFENIVAAKKDSTYSIRLVVSDASKGADTAMTVIKVVDVNEAPVAEDAKVTIPETGATSACDSLHKIGKCSQIGDKLTDVIATDEDIKTKFNTLVYTLIDNTDKFKMGTGKTKNTIYIKDTLDYETTKDHKITIHVEVRDSLDKNLKDTAEIIVTLTDVIENPIIIIDDDDDEEDDEEEDCVSNCGHKPPLCVHNCNVCKDGSPDCPPKKVPEKDTLTVGILENSATGAHVLGYYVEDPDAGEVAKLTAELHDLEKGHAGKDHRAENLFVAKMVKSGENYRVEVHVKDGALLNYEEIMKELNDSLYSVSVVVTDPNGLKDSVVRIISVEDVNELPIIAGFDATDEDSAYVKKVTINDKNDPLNGKTIEVINFYEPMTRFNPSANMFIATMHGDDIDIRDPFRQNEFKIVGGDVYLKEGDTKMYSGYTIKDLFAIDDSTGRVTTGPKLPQEAFDYELVFGYDSTLWEHPNLMPYHFSLVVELSDKNDASLKVLDTLYLKILNRNEPPRIVNTSFEVAENAPEGTLLCYPLPNGGKNCLMTAQDWDDPHGNPKGPTFTVVTQDTSIIIKIDPEDSTHIDTNVIVKYFDKETSTYITVGDSTNGTKTIGGQIKVKDPSKLDFEHFYDSKTGYSCFTFGGRVDDNDGLHYSDTITVCLTDVNEPPVIPNGQKFTIREDSEIGTTVGKVVAEDPDLYTEEFHHLTFTLVADPTKTFAVDSNGKITLIDTLDYETRKEYTIKVRVTDGEFADTNDVKIIVTNVEEWTEVKITKVENSDSTWGTDELISHHDTLYTNVDTNHIDWVWDDHEMDTTVILKEGPNPIIVKYKNPSKDYAGADTVVIIYSTLVPEVKIQANGDDVNAGNIYTIVQKTDGEDETIYVKDKSNDIKVTVYDKATNTKDTIKVKLPLDTVGVAKNTFKEIETIMEAKLVLEDNPENLSKVHLNSETYKMSYTEKVNGKTVTVTYYTDKKGNVEKKPVVGDDGKTEDIEVITVTYTTTVGGKEVKVSYMADAVTGQILVTDHTGKLMTISAAEDAIKDTKKPSLSSSSGKPSSSSSGSETKEPSESPNIGNPVISEYGLFQVNYVFESNKDTLNVSYSVGKDYNIITNSQGDKGYNVSYTYTNKFGNTATQTVFMVLDQIAPVVKIISPVNGDVIRANFVNVVWTVDGVEQDSLTVQGLEKGKNNRIVRIFKDKAGNEASDTVYVIMKDIKDIEIAVENPVTEITQDMVDEFYSDNPPEKGQDYAVSILNPTTEEEYETLKGGSMKSKSGKVKTKPGSGKNPYPNVDGVAHLGPTLSLDIKVPVATAVGGLPTLDDLLSPGGEVLVEGVDADNSEKISVEQYRDEYCLDEFVLESDLSKTKLYDIKMDVQIWVYTTIGGFVDYFRFTQPIDNPDYTNKAGLLKMYFEQKPDKDGNVHTANGKLYATGSYLYKVEVSMKSKLLCSLPPLKDANGKKKGDILKSKDDLLTNFGYRRPPKK
ncbi:MAG: cadherin repeat domain-containing protein [Fibrobacter sp.]|nr:cadherin repeat domain-containing protein [Fibrobacter sp.]